MLSSRLFAIPSAPISGNTSHKLLRLCRPSQCHQSQPKFNSKPPPALTLGSAFSAAADQAAAVAGGGDGGDGRNTSASPATADKEPERRGLQSRLAELGPVILVLMVLFMLCIGSWEAVLHRGDNAFANRKDIKKLEKAMDWKTDKLEEAMDRNMDKLENLIKDFRGEVLKKLDKLEDDIKEVRDEQIMMKVEATGSKKK